MKFKPFTPAQYDLLVQMKADGRSWTEIGEAIGHSANSCSSIYSVRKNKKPRGNGATNPWTKDQVELLQTMVEQNRSWEDCAAACGHSANSCKVAFNTRRRKREQGPNPQHGMPEPGSRVSVTPQALADREARYRARMLQSPAAQLMGEPPPGWSALDRKMASGSAAP